MNKEDKGDIDRLVAQTLDSASHIDTVETPPFFKDKVLNRMERLDTEKAEDDYFLSWFGPKYQAAALICFVLFNMIALLSNTSDTYNEDVEEFADTYGLSETEIDSYFNETEIDSYFNMD